jgi:hypothetical protein
VDTGLGEVIKEATASNKDVDLPSLLEFRTKKGLVDALRHCTGEGFVEAVALSISMEKMESDEHDVSLDTQQAVIGQLRECKC